MAEIDLNLLNTARSWWLVTKPHTGHVPDDAEILTAYRRYHQEGFVLWHRRDECDAPGLCRFHGNR